MHGGNAGKKVNTQKGSEIWEFLYHHNKGSGKDVGLLEENQLFLGKMNGPLEEEMRDCDKVCLDVVSPSLLSCDNKSTCDKSIFPGW